MFFDQALDNFIAVVQKKINEYYRTGFSNLKPPIITAEQGKRYTKIIQEHETQRFVYCFIDGNGDILKSASWRAPAKGVRGSIYQEFDSIITEYGIKYLR